MNSFSGNRYTTRGIVNTIPPTLQFLLWRLIDNMPNLKHPPASRDYLQVFRLYNKRNSQGVIHTQEQPPYKDSYSFPLSMVGVEKPIVTKIFVIDDGDHCTMLLADEY